VCVCRPLFLSHSPVAFRDIRRSDLVCARPAWNRMRSGRVAISGRRPIKAFKRTARSSCRSVGERAGLPLPAVFVHRLTVNYRRLARPAPLSRRRCRRPAGRARSSWPGLGYSVSLRAMHSPPDY